MNWPGSGFITIINYSGLASGHGISPFAILTETSVDIFTENSQDILTEASP